MLMRVTWCLVVQVLLLCCCDCVLGSTAIVCRPVPVTDTSSRRQAHTSRSAASGMSDAGSGDEQVASSGTWTRSGTLTD